jgi:hypothetical protein
MKRSFSFVRPTGTIGRGPYALIGIFGFAIKHNLDRIVATLGFHRPWGLFNYWIPVRDVANVMALQRDQQIFLATMVALSLPFIWVGVVLTLQRLRSARLPAWLVALFFAPFVNLAFFIVLCILPERDSLVSQPVHAPHWIHALPENAIGSAAISLLVTVPLGLGLGTLGATVFKNYGWGLFVAVPFVMGFVAAWLYGLRRPRGLSSSIGVACLSVALLAGVLFALLIEGLVCLIMAAPLAFPLAAFGGFCANKAQKSLWLQGDAPVILSLLVLLAPSVQATEHAASRPSPVFVVRTSLDIAAPPERVWQQVIAFTKIPEPTEWMFRAGIAYPMRAEMHGAGVGAERHCVFSTGAFVEPIEVWDEPHLLKFSVISNPAPMEEWTPYSRIDTPHLHGFLVSEGGQFLLTPLPNGGTRLEGTTWYQHGLWPAQYWRLWSDEIIHKIHLRVLQHIRDEVEIGNQKR